MQGNKWLVIKFTEKAPDDQVIWQSNEYDSYDVRGEWFMVFRKNRMIGMYKLEHIISVEYK